MRLASAGLAVEDEVLGGVDERQRLQVVFRVAVRHPNFGEIVALERLDLREPRPPVQPCALVVLPDVKLVFEKVHHGAQLRRASAAQEPIHGLVGEVHAARTLAELFGIVFRPDGHGYTAFLIAVSYTY